MNPSSNKYQKALRCWFESEKRLAAIGNNERMIAYSILAIIIGLKFLCAVNYRIDSDEPQHLHVVWAWTQGLLPYKDLFDNHAPLFQMLCAPIFHLLGERADILIPMRVAMIPLFAICIWLVKEIGSSISLPRAGLWAAVFTACYPPFFLTSTEFRPDNLWAAIWLSIIWIFVAKPRTSLTFFWVGFLLGVDFCVSMKSVLLLIALICAIGMMWAFGRFNGEHLDLQKIGTRCVFALLGLVLLPVLVTLSFVLHGAGGEMFQGILAHNVMPGKMSAVNVWVSGLRWIALIALPIWFYVWMFGRVQSEERQENRRWMFVYLVTLFYFATLKSFWAFVTAEDFLPFYPLVILILSGALLVLIDKLPNRIRSVGQHIPVLIAVGCLAFSFIGAAPFHNQTREKLGIVANALRLTNPDEYVMDSKGETIFRRRASRLVFEEITGLRLKRGLIHDDIIERLVATRAPVASLLRMPNQTSTFIEQNYIPVAYRLRVLGQILHPDNDYDGFNFEIVIPAHYSILAENDVVSGTLNGEVWTGSRILAEGHYCFRRNSGTGKLALIWTRAVEKGFSPFLKVKPDNRDEQD
jgi:hypothetical protein